VLFAHGWPLRGKATAKEIRTAADAVLDAAEQASGLDVYCKPHPSDTQSGLRARCAERGSDSILYVEPEAPIEDLLAEVDVVVTKISSVGFEALAADCAVVQVILDAGGDPWAAQYGGSADTYRDATALRETLIRLAADEAAREEWVSDHARRRRAFVEANFFPERDPISDIVTELERRLD